MDNNVFEVLMYIYDNHADVEHGFVGEQQALRGELLRAGFGADQVEGALAWIDALVVRAETARCADLDGNGGLRLFNAREMQRLDRDCRGFLLHLEQSGIIGAQDRELVIDRVMALDSDDIDLPRLRWIILMVLLSQPGRDAAQGWLEDLVMDDTRSTLH